MPTLDSSTRDRIVESATELIMERGYDKTTMRAIAERAEVSLGSAYYYFGGKEELIQGFYTRIARETAAAAERNLIASLQDRAEPTVRPLTPLRA